ncbi:MAG: hypothetical protein ACTSYB_08565 [Candidatus Helarchaeota archaeon]
MTNEQENDFSSLILKLIIILFVTGLVLTLFYLILPMLINPLPAIFYSFTYLGFISIFLSFIFFFLFSLKVQNIVIYIAAVWISSGFFIIILNQFVYTQFFSDLLLKYFSPLYAVLFCAVGFVLLMVEIVRYLYLKPPEKPQ